MNEITDHRPTPAEAAFARLEEFPSDYIETAAHIAATKRMDEMDAWANGIGAHTERLAATHRMVGQGLVQSVDKSGVFDPEAAKDRLARVPRDWRTGVRVEKNGDIEVSSKYPFYGDTPAEGWQTYRAPKNIRKS